MVRGSIIFVGWLDRCILIAIQVALERMMAVEDRWTFALRYHAELDPIGVLVYKTEL